MDKTLVKNLIAENQDFVEKRIRILRLFFRVICQN
jgi:hypothetical protein